MSANNTLIIHQLLKEVWNKRNLAVMDEMFLTEAFIHDPAVPQVTTVESLKQFIASYLAAFPDLHLMLDDCFAAEDKVATRWTVQGTHKGAFLGIAPTDQLMTVMGITLFRLSSDKVAEYWSQWDSSGLMQQLGSVTPTKPSTGA